MGIRPDVTVMPEGNVVPGVGWNDEGLGPSDGTGHAGCGTTNPARDTEIHHIEIEDDFITLCVSLRIYFLVITCRI